MANDDIRCETIVYKEMCGCPLRLLVCKPPDWRADDERTALVWIHGGGWRGGNPDMFARHCRQFAERGAVTFSVQYRLIPREGEAAADCGAAAGVEDCIADCRSAVRYIREHARQLGIRPDRIAVAGDSAGGHLAACLATMPDDDAPGGQETTSAMADLVVNCNGIVDFTGKWKAMVPQVTSVDDGGDARVRAWLAQHEHAKALSPLYHVSSGQPPMLIMHGLGDEVVVPEDAVRFHEAYTAAGNDAELALYDGWKHAFVLFDYTAAEADVLHALARIDDFLVARRFLPPAGN